MAAGVIESGGRYLIAQRPPGGRLPLVWEFPGGKREPDEAWEACLARELREELGITVRVGNLVEAATHAFDDLVVTLRFYRCALLAGEPAPLGCEGVRWIAPAELARYEFPPADAALVAWLAGDGAPGPGAERPRTARVSFLPGGRSAEVPVGTALEEAASRARAALPFGCRSGSCGACLVAVAAPAGLSRATTAERAVLREAGAPPGHRLGCRARVLGDVVVEHLPPRFPFV